MSVLFKAHTIVAIMINFILNCHNEVLATNLDSMDTRDVIKRGWRFSWKCFSTTHSAPPCGKLRQIE